MRHLFIRDLIKGERIEVRYVKSKNNLTDVLTKNAKKKIFEKHSKAIIKGKVKYETKEENKVNEMKYEFKVKKGGCQDDQCRRFK